MSAVLPKYFSLTTTKWVGSLLLGISLFLAKDAASQNVINHLNGLSTFSAYVTNALKEDGFKQQSIANKITYFAEKQTGMAYGAGLLEQPIKERLICRADSTDCVLFVENTLAMAFSSVRLTERKLDEPSAQLLNEIEHLRYRDGIINGYESRLHYFSDWIYEHAIKDGNASTFELLFQDKELPLLDKPRFMSSKRHLYPKLATDDEMLGKIKQNEAWLAQNVAIHYIPEEDLVNYEGQLQDGDVFAFVSSVKGLDVSHTAIISVEEQQSSRRVSFWHASTKNGVEQYGKSLRSYLNGMKSVTGIVVLRVKG